MRDEYDYLAYKAFRFELADKGFIPPWDDRRDPVRFDVGRLRISREVVARLPVGRIAYYVDMHRRGRSDAYSVASDEHIQSMIQMGLSVASFFFTKGPDLPEQDALLVLTNRHRTRTVIRFQHETTNARNRRIGMSTECLGRAWARSQRDYFNR